MIRLGTKREPVWLELGNGVRVRLRPFTAVAEMAAQRVAHAYLAGVPAGQEADPDAFQEAWYVELGRRAIDAWEGVLDQDGEPAPCEPDLVEQLLRNFTGMCVNFKHEWIMRVVVLGEEKNVSAPSPNGTSATGPSTVQDAAAPSSLALQ
jgi:hypothetical protein